MSCHSLLFINDKLIDSMKSIVIDIKLEVKTPSGDSLQLRVISSHIYSSET